MASVCSLCPRRCGAVRGEGFCRMGALPVVARVALHFDEEPCISGAAGSGAVFFSGCALKCVFCQNEKISRGGVGREVSLPALRASIEALLESGANNVNFVNPTHFSHAIMEMLKEPFSKSVVWNSSGYESLETLRALNGKVDIYLPDVKYVSPALSKRYSGAEDYFDVARQAVLEMARQVGPARYSDDGIMLSGLMIRHLILPGCHEDSKKVLDFIHREVPFARVSLMAQYVPCGPATKIPALNRRITQAEYDDVLEHLFFLGLEDGYVQELSSADEGYIPAFDLTGVDEVWDNDRHGRRYVTED